MSAPRADPISMNPPPATSGWPIVAIAAMLWGTDILLRPRLLGSHGLTPAMVVLCEHVALAIIFLPIVIRRRSEMALASSRDKLALLFLAWAGSAIATILLTNAYRTGSPLVATLLQKTQPVFAVYLASSVLKESRKSLFWLWFSGSMIATYLLSFGFTAPLGALQGSVPISVFCALGAAGIWGACTVVGRFALGDISPPVVAGWRFILAVPLLIVLNLPALTSNAGPGLAWAATPAIWLIIAAIVLFPDVLGMTLYYIGLKRTPASIATIAELAYPISALMLGLLFAHQHLEPGQWVGLALLFACLQGLHATSSVGVAAAPSRPLTFENSSPSPVQHPQP